MPARLVALAAPLVMACCVAPWGNARSTYLRDATHDGLERIASIEPVMGRGAAPVDRNAALAELGSEPKDQPPPPLGDWESSPLTLDKLRSAVIAHNLNLEVARLQREGSRQGVFEALGLLQPTINGGVNSTETDSVAGASRDRSTTLSGNVGMTIPLLIGGSVDLSYDLSETDLDETSSSGATISSLPGSGSAGPSLSLAIPLLRNAGPMVAQAGIRVAAFELGASTARLRNQVQSLLLQAEDAYWSLYEAFSAVEIARSQVDVANEQIVIGERRLAAQQATVADVYRLKIAYNKQRQSLIEANRSLRQQMREVLSLMQKPSVKLSLDDKRLMRPSTEASLVYRDLAGVDLAAIAIANRSELMEDQFNIAAAELQWKVAESGTLPDLSLTMGVGASGFGSSYDGAMSNSWDVLSHPTLNAGVSFSMTLGYNQSAMARAEAARLDYVQSIATRDGRLITIRKQVFNARDEYVAAWAQVLQQAQNLSLAEQSYATQKDLFEAGLATTNTLIDSLEELRTARQNELRAIVRYQKSVVNLALTTGTLTKHAGVELQRGALGR